MPEMNLEEHLSLLFITTLVRKLEQAVTIAPEVWLFCSKNDSTERHYPGQRKNELQGHDKPVLF